MEWTSCSGICEIGNSLTMARIASFQRGRTNDKSGKKLTLNHTGRFRPGDVK